MIQLRVGYLQIVKGTPATIDEQQFFLLLEDTLEGGQQDVCVSLLKN